MVNSLNQAAATQFRPDLVIKNGKTSELYSTNKEFKAEMDKIDTWFEANKEEKLRFNSNGVSNFLNQIAAVDGNNKDLSLDANTTEGQILGLFTDLEAAKKGEDPIRKEAIEKGIVEVPEDAYQNTQFRERVVQQAALEKETNYEGLINGKTSEEFGAAFDMHFVKKKHETKNVIPQSLQNTSGYLYGKGNAEPRIVTIQQWLNNQQLLPDKIKEDGIFGANTKEAIIKFQEKHNAENPNNKIPTDGIWGPLTEAIARTKGFEGFGALPGLDY